MAVDPEGSIAQLKGIGPKLQETLGRLGIFRLLDLLIHLPTRYQDRSLGKDKRNDPNAPGTQCYRHLFSGGQSRERHPGLHFRTDPPRAESGSVSNDHGKRRLRRPGPSGF